MTIEKTRLEQLGRLDAAAFRDSEKLPVIVVLDNVRSAHNIGSIFRTCDAFRVAAVYLTGICAVPPHKEIMKTALGAADTVIWKYFETTLQALQELKNDNYYIASVEQTTNSITLETFIPSAKTAYVFGNEVNGVDQEVLQCSDACVEIPQFGTKHSFNVSITTGIVLWDSFLKRKAFQQ